MTFKNGIKEALLTFLLFGGLMGIYFGLDYESIAFGIIGGVASGGLFTLLTFIFTWIMEAKFAKLRKQIEKERRVICDGGATYSGIGGWLYFTEWGFDFYPHKINTSTKEILIDRKDVYKVSIKQNKLVLETNDGILIDFIVSKNKKWLELING